MSESAPTNPLPLIQKFQLTNNATVQIFDHVSQRWVKTTNNQAYTGLGCQASTGDYLFGTTLRRNDATKFIISQGGSPVQPITTDSSVQFTYQNGKYYLTINGCGLPTQSFFGSTLTNIPATYIYPISISGGKNDIYCYKSDDFKYVKNLGASDRANNLYLQTNLGGTFYIKQQKLGNNQGWGFSTTKGDAGHFEFFLVGTTCSNNTDCTGSDMCFNGQCLATTSIPNSDIFNICQGSNVATPQCVNWGQNLSTKNSLRASYGDNLAKYCREEYDKTNIPPSSGPCVCLTAANQLNAKAPECFYPGCNGGGTDIFYTNQMVTNLAQGGCKGQCNVIINCPPGQCTYDNNLFCNVCGNEQGASAKCGGNWFKTMIEYITKYEKQIAIVLAVLVALALAAVIFKKK